MPTAVADLHLRARKHPWLVLVTGCFDILHCGHLALLEHAKTLGDVFVGLNSDRAIRDLKGPGRPINNFDCRARLMAAIVYVDGVFEIDDTRVEDAILECAPDFWVKGGDYTMASLDPGEVAAARAVGAKIVLFKSPGPLAELSTTKILKDATVTPLPICDHEFMGTRCVKCGWNPNLSYA